MIKTRKKFWGLFVLLVLALFVITIFAVSLGSVPVNLQDILQSFTQTTTIESKILWSIRYPRIVLTILAGINFSLSGLMIQGVLKNPLTDSNILGANAGASLMAVIFLVLFPEQSGVLPVASFIGGMLAFLLVVQLAWGKYGSTIRLILTGIAVRAVVSGIEDVIVTLNSDQLQGIVMWLAGDLSGKTWEEVGYLTLYSLPAYILAFLLHHKMDLLQLDDSLVHSLGVSSRNYRLVIASLGVYLSSITVSFVGMIGFIGLIIPHIARILVGGKHQRLLTYSFVLGPLLLLLADTVSRSVAAPLEIPIGTTMSLIGGPFFIYLLYRQTKRRI